MSDAIFESPFKLCRWAEGEINNFELLCDKLLREHPPQLVTTIYPITGANVAYPADIVIPPEALDGLERSAYRIVTDLRNALDQACHHASVAIGSANENKTNFPMAEDEIDFDRRLTNAKGSFTGIPVQLHRKLKEMSPFWSYRDGRKGNTKLRTIGKIANPNKHKVPLTVGYKTNGIGIANCFDINMVFNPLNRISNPDRPEIHWKIIGPNPVFEVDFHTQIRITDAGIFSHHDAISAFREMYSTAIRAVEDIKEEFLKIIARA